MVFAPHQDDETLGCGGTIITRIGTGTDVAIVFMTEGRTSHAHLIPPSELVKIRRQEALAASRVLGIEEESVTFLDFEDGRLSEHYAAAVARVSSLLHEYKPDEVFIPYHREPNLDHLATNRIVLTALSAVGIAPVVCEYPVWTWHHWPWVSLRQHTPPGTRAVIHNTFANVFGIRLLKDFGYSSFIGDVIGQKAAALNEHRSQMTRLLPDPGWLTLSDVSDGDFLACFFQDYEVFYRYRF